MEGGRAPDATPLPPEVGESQLRTWLAYQREEHALAVATFEACTRDALRSANERLLVSRSSPTGQVAQPFIIRFDETVQSWCDGDRSLAACASYMVTPRPSPSATPATPSATAVAAPSSSALPYALSCGPMEQSACEAWAARAVASATELHPGKKVVTVRITGPDGDYDLLFDDGTGILSISN